ncbi:hypothetical protein RQP46_006134 [Phenoliferia psychrophenolica]
MDELEDALASAALDGQDVAAREPGASSPPFLPPELIADIIDLAVESLVEQERSLPSQIPLTNRFLLSAALVDRTWNAIATSALLRNGLVQPGGVDKFLEHTEECGVRETLDRVRFGAGAKGLIVQPDADPPDEGADDEPFERLVMSLTNLGSVELVGKGLRFKAALAGPYCIQHLTISNVTYLKPPLLAEKFSIAPPARLSIIETQYFPLDDDRIDVRLQFLSFLSKVRHMDLYTTQITPDYHISILLLLGIMAGSFFESFRLACDNASWRPRFLVPPDPAHWNPHPPKNAIIFPNLNHLTTHFASLHYLAICTGARFTLTSLQVLPDVNPQQSPISDENAELKLCEIVEKLAALRELKVPECWRSDAVEDACEAKGVDLWWT